MPINDCSIQNMRNMERAWEYNFSDEGDSVVSKRIVVEGVMESEDIISNFSGSLLIPGHFWIVSYETNVLPTTVFTLNFASMGVVSRVMHTSDVASKYKRVRNYLGALHKIHVGGTTCCNDL